MATKLQIWNRALRALRKDRLATLTDNVAVRYELTDCWGQVVADVAEAGLWNFGIVTAAVSATSDLTAIAGYQYGFSHPSTWIRTIQVSASSRFDTEIDYRDENGAIFANVTPIYLRYLATTKFGDDYVSTWPQSFASVVTARLAFELSEVLGESTAMRDSLRDEFEAAMRRAKNLDAMNQPQIRFKEGSWSRAMSGGHRGRGDRGSLFPADISFDITGDV